MQSRALYLGMLVLFSLWLAISPPLALADGEDYALHGTYWHNNFGQPMSRGCVNLSIADAKWLFEWTSPKLPEGHGVVSPTDAEPGTEVVIHP